MSEIPAHNSEGMKPRDSMSFPEISRQVLEDIGEIIKSGKNNTLRILLLVTLAAAGTACEKKEYEAPDREGRIFDEKLPVAKDGGSNDASQPPQSNGMKMVEIPTPEHLVYRGPRQSPTPATAVPPAAQPNPVEYVSVKPEKWQVILDPQYDSKYPHVGYVDENGKNVFGNTYFHEAKPFKEGLAVVKYYKGKKYYYINKNGENAFGDKEFDVATSFNDGIALVKKAGEAKWYYLNKRGANAFGSKEFDDATSFKEGLAAVQVEEKWFYVNRKGVNALGGKVFDEAKAFSEGLGEVSANGNWYYINKKGERAFGKKKFTQTSPFKDGFANVVEGIRPYTIDKTGEQIQKADKHP